MTDTDQAVRRVHRDQAADVDQRTDRVLVSAWLTGRHCGQSRIWVSLGSRPEVGLDCLG
jgi:hypothetical protein